MPDRPSIPLAIVREILIESGHRCAVCGAGCPLERAHIIPWHKTQEHRAEDLICLCASCHERADNERWGEATLRAYKQKPWVLRQYNENTFPGPTKKVELTIELELSQFDERNQRLLQYALAAFLEIPAQNVRIVTIEEGSVKVTLELPEDSAKKLLEAYAMNASELQQYLAPLVLTDLQEKQSSPDPRLVLTNPQERQSSPDPRSEASGRRKSVSKANYSAVSIAVAEQNRRYRWGLTVQKELAYATALVAHIPQTSSNSLMMQVVQNYHLDHRFVEALLDVGSLEGQEAWQRCCEQLPTLLHYAQLRWAMDKLQDLDDLTQIGAVAIFQALPQFHYFSRFSTWMFQVFRNSVLRTLRDQKAGKRYSQTDSYDEHPVLEPVLSASVAVESPAQYNALVALIDEILAEDPDQRVRHIFLLWTFDGARLADISQITGLSQSRVRVFLERARQRLRQDHRMQEWLDVLLDKGASTDSSSTGPSLDDALP